MDPTPKLMRAVQDRLTPPESVCILAFWSTARSPERFLEEFSGECRGESTTGDQVLSPPRVADRIAFSDSLPSIPCPVYYCVELSMQALSVLTRRLGLCLIVVSLVVATDSV